MISLKWRERLSGYVNITSLVIFTQGGESTLEHTHTFYAKKQCDFEKITNSYYVNFIALIYLKRDIVWKNLFVNGDEPLSPSMVSSEKNNKSEYDYGLWWLWIFL